MTRLRTGNRRALRKRNVKQMRKRFGAYGTRWSETWMPDKPMRDLQSVIDAFSNFPARNDILHLSANVWSLLFADRIEFENQNKDNGSC